MLPTLIGELRSACGKKPAAQSARKKGLGDYIAAEG